MDTANGEFGPALFIADDYSGAIQTINSRMTGQAAAEVGPAGGIFTSRPGGCSVHSTGIAEDSYSNSVYPNLLNWVVDDTLLWISFYPPSCFLT